MPHSLLMLSRRHPGQATRSGSADPGSSGYLRRQPLHNHLTVLPAETPVFELSSLPLTRLRWIPDKRSLSLTGPG